MTDCVEVIAGKQQGHDWSGATRRNEDNTNIMFPGISELGVHMYMSCVYASIHAHLNVCMCHAFGIQLQTHLFIYDLGWQHWLFSPGEADRKVEKGGILSCSIPRIRHCWFD